VAYSKKIDDKTFSVGSMIIKEKKGHNHGAPTGDVITVMEKVSDKGTANDWIFKISSLSDKKDLTDEFNKTMPMTCTKCHSQYANDFVSDTFNKIRYKQ
jgi:hypothetical protein